MAKAATDSGGISVVGSEMVEEETIHTSTSSVTPHSGLAGQIDSKASALSGFSSSRTKLSRSLSDQYISPINKKNVVVNAQASVSSFSGEPHATNSSRFSAPFSPASLLSADETAVLRRLFRQNTAPVPSAVAVPRSSSFPELSKPQIARQITTNGDRQCWICYAQESEEPSDTRDWVSPCKCHGTTQWVHQQCLTRWIDARQRGNIQAKVKCPQCNTIYRIKFKSLGTLTRMLDVMDILIARSMPYAAGGVLLASVYWTAASYGAFTMVLILGPRDAMRFIEERDSPTLLIALPTIPVLLVLLRTVEWHEMIFSTLLRIQEGFSIVFSSVFGGVFNSRQTVIRREKRSPMLTSSAADEAVEQQNAPAATEDENGPQQVLAHKHSSPSRTLCGGLLMPVFAAVTGRLLYQNVFPDSRWRQVLAGGATFLAAKAVVQIFYRRRKLAQFKSRRVMDYNEAAANAAAASNLSTPSQTSSGSEHTGAEQGAAGSSMLVHDSDDDEALLADLANMEEEGDENEDDDGDDAVGDDEEEQGDDPSHPGSHEYRLLVHIEL